MAASRKPDYRLKAMDTATDAKAEVGCAWINPNGSISVKLNHWVVLKGEKTLILTLFPADEPSDG